MGDAGDGRNARCHAGGPRRLSRSRSTPAATHAQSHLDTVFARIVEKYRMVSPNSAGNAAGHVKLSTD